MKFEFNKSKVLKLILFVFVFILFFNFSSAKFICGEIVPDGMNLPSWHDVNASVYSDSSIMTTCQVNPLDFKYCCDIESLQDSHGYTWKVGDSFKVEIVDFYSGLMAGPVYGVLSDESYDIFSRMELREIFQVRKPVSNILISSEGDFSVDLNIFDDCDFGRIVNSSREVLCEGGCDYRSDFDSGFGFVELEFYAECGEYDFFKNISGFVISDFNVNRDLSKKIKNKEGVEINLNLEISNFVDSVEFREYVPVSFEVFDVSHNGKVEMSNSDYSVIVWELNGSNFDFSYNVMPSSSGDFSFVSELEGNFGFLENITVYDFVPPVRKSRGGGSSYVYKPKNFSRVNENMGIVSKIDNLTIALYSNNFTDKGAFEILDFNFSGKMYNRSLDLISSYLLETNLGDNTGKVSFELGLDKDYLNEKKYSDIEAYGVDSKGKMFKLNGRVIMDEFEEMKFVSYDNDFFGKVVLYGVKENLTFWDKVLNWFWGLGFKI